MFYDNPCSRERCSQKVHREWLQAEVLTNTVENHHVIVDGITDNGKDCRNERLIHIKIEWEDSAEQREESDDDDGCVCKLISN